jgi:hypothetical protein
MSKPVCRQHDHWLGGRCTRCGIQSRNFAEAMSALREWPEQDKASGDYKRILELYLCKPHTHEAA